MTRKKRVLYLILPILVLSLAVLACSGGYSTSRKVSGNSGEVRVKTKAADGLDTTSVEINEDWSYARIGATATLSVESGSCQGVLVGEEGTRMELNASAGSAGSAIGDLVTDGFGEVDLDLNCQGASNVEVFVTFTRK